MINKKTEKKSTIVYSKENGKIWGKDIEGNTAIFTLTATEEKTDNASYKAIMLSITPLGSNNKVMEDENKKIIKYSIALKRDDIALLTYQLDLLIKKEINQFEINYSNDKGQGRGLEIFRNEDDAVIINIYEIVNSTTGDIGTFVLSSLKPIFLDVDENTGEPTSTINVEVELLVLYYNLISCNAYLTGTLESLTSVGGSSDGSRPARTGGIIKTRDKKIATVTNNNNTESNEYENPQEEQEVKVKKIDKSKLAAMFKQED